MQNENENEDEDKKEKEKEEKQFTMASLCAFNLFDNDDNKDKEIKENDDENDDDNEDQEEDDIKAMKQLRLFPNVGFSRYITNTSPSFSNTITNTVSITNNQSYNQTTNKPIPQHNNDFISTQHSSLNSSYFPSQNQPHKNRMHKTLPLQNPYMNYPQYGFSNSIPFPYQQPYYNYPPSQPQQPNYFIPPSHQSLQFPTSNCFSPQSQSQPQNHSTLKQSPRKENFDSLQSFLSFLKNGKQIGNYIKSRSNSTTMLNLLKKLSKDEITELITLIQPKLKDIMISNNQFSQKLFEQCTPEHRLTILSTIKDTFIEIALNKWGSYSLQTLIKVISLPEEQEMIKKCIEGKVFELAMDKQGNFVLQKFVLLLNEKGMSIIIDDILAIFNHLIHNSTGIALLKNLILTNKGSEIRRRFVGKVAECLSDIINNPNGHTLILHMMDKWDYETCKGIIGEIAKDVQKYVLMKHAMIVVMKCVTMSDQKTIKGIYMQLFRSEIVVKLMKSDHGKELIKEIFGRLQLKGRNEAYKMIEMTLMVIKEEQDEKEKNGLARTIDTSPILKFINDLINMK